MMHRCFSNKIHLAMKTYAILHAELRAVHGWAHPAKEEKQEHGGMAEVLQWEVKNGKSLYIMGPVDQGSAFWGRYVVSVHMFSMLGMSRSKSKVSKLLQPQR